MKLAYQAFDQSGKAITDAIDAASVTEAAEALRRRGLYVTRIRPAEDRAAAPSGGRKRSHGRGSRLRSLAMFTRQMFVLVSTGTPVAEALVAVQRQTNDATLGEVVDKLRLRVEEGQPLSEAMAEHPDYFDPIYCALIEAGEAAGKLSPMLDRLAMLVRKQLHVRSSILGAMAYPSLLIVVAMSVLVLMLTFVLPRFSGLFETLEVPLPSTTVALMMASNALRGYWWLIAPGLIATITAAILWANSASGKQTVNSVMLRLPTIGPLVRNFASARIARLLGVMLDSHLPLQEALKHIRLVTGNAQYARMIDRAEQYLTRGEALSSAFNDPRLIHPAVYEAIRNGEQSGQVAKLAITIADFIDEENEVVVKSLTSIIEPIILIGLGVMVGFVAVSMFLPLFDLTAMTGSGG